MLTVLLVQTCLLTDFAISSDDIFGIGNQGDHIFLLPVPLNFFDFPFVNLGSQLLNLFEMGFNLLVDLSLVQALLL